MADALLKFVEEGHKYFYNDVEVPSVHEVIRSMGQGADWSFVPGYYRDRGHAVHLAIRYFLEGTLDRASLDPVILPYLERFERFLEKISPVDGIVLSEEPFYSINWEYAGTIDLIMNGAIWDIKCSKNLDSGSRWEYDLQGAGYKTLANENTLGDLPFKLLLLGDAEAKEVPLNAPYRAWENLMELYNIKNDRIPFGRPNDS